MGERDGHPDRWQRLLALRDDGSDDEGDHGTDHGDDGRDADGPGSADGGAGSGRLRARLGRLCSVSVAEVGTGGAAVTVMAGVEAGRAGRRDQLWASGPLARRLEDLQLTTGEGPCVDAYRLGAPVLIGDLAAQTARWLGFAPEALGAGVAAVFSLPLQVGAVRLGTLDLHRAVVGGLSRDQLADALVLASMATETLLELAAEPGDRETEDREGAMGWLPTVHADVHVASGMVSARQEVDVGVALLRLRGHAFARGEPIGRVARRIIDRDLVLDDRLPVDPRTHHDRDDPEDGPTGTGTERNR